MPLVLYLLQQPRTLETMATEKLIDWISIQAEKILSSVARLQQHDPTQAEQLLSRQIKTFRIHLENKIPRMFFDELAKKSIEALSQLSRKIKRVNQLKNSPIQDVQKKIVGRMIEVLFTNNLTYLSIEDSYTEDLIEDLLFTKTYMLFGLTHLDLMDCAPREADIIRLLKELYNLKYLRLANVCPDNVLQIIVDYCTLIETLYLTFPKINDDSIGILTQLRHLRSVDLKSKSLTKEGMATLLMSCENIEHISISGPKFDITDVLEHITSFENNARKQFKIKSYKMGYKTLKQIQLVVKMCPLIQKVSLSKTPKNTLKPLNDLENLHQLELDGFNFYADEVKQLLQIRGRNLVELDLENIRQIDINALKYICLLCPNLQSLKVSHPSVSKVLVHNSSLSIKEIPPLKYLKRLTLRDYQYNADFVESSIFLLSISPNIEFINCELDFGDKIILQVLDKNPKQLVYLKELRIRNNLSMIGLDRVVRNCVHPPEIILAEYY